MSKRFSLIAFAVILCAQTGFAQQKDAFNKDSFNVETLSQQGRAAYEKLLTSGLFAVGGVGYSENIFDDENALYDLLKEKAAVDALKSLVRQGTMEGGLYGLLGLSVINVEAFNQSVDVYKARTEFPTGRLPHEGMKVRQSRDWAATQIGCILFPEDRLKVVQEIQSGHYDKILDRRKLGRH